LTTLYIRHPARADGEGALAGFALVADSGELVQQGEGALKSMGDLVGSARHVVLLLAAPDVTLLQVKVPPLSNARLKAALPNLVEEQVLGDPDDCVLVAAPGHTPDGMRAVAVTERAPLEATVRLLLSQGARTVAALPAQLCLPISPGQVAGAVEASGITLRHGQYQGMGLAIGDDPESALQTVRALGGAAPMTLYVPHEQLGQYQALAAEAAPELTLEPLHWPVWIAGAKSTTMDLVPGLGSAGAKAHDWQRWRWPLRIALAAVVVNLVGLNVQWMGLESEAEATRAAMLQTFRSTYPKQTVILDPAAQMRSNIAAAKAAHGQVNADEFTFMVAAFGEAAGSLPRRPLPASMAYRERALTIKVKPETFDASMTEQLKPALAARKLELTEAGPGTWLIRSTGGTP
jgi:general secretion pathway protein L